MKVIEGKFGDNDKEGTSSTEVFKMFSEMSEEANDEDAVAVCIYVTETGLSLGSNAPSGAEVNLILDIAKNYLLNSNLEPETVH